MKTLVRWTTVVTALLLGMIAIPRQAQSQEVTVRGRVTINPLMSECLHRNICERDIALGLYREEDWVPTTAAVNIAVKGTNRVAKTDRDGNYTITVPSADATLVFMYIGFSRVEVPVNRRPVIDFKLTPQPMPEIEAILRVTTPLLHSMQTPNIDEVARQVGSNRETVRDLIWLTIGSRPFAAAYPNEYIPDYRFDAAAPAAAVPVRGVGGPAR